MHTTTTGYVDECGWQTVNLTVNQNNRILTSFVTLSLLFLSLFPNDEFESRPTASNDQLLKIVEQALNKTERAAVERKSTRTTVSTALLYNRPAFLKLRLKITFCIRDDN